MCDAKENIIGTFVELVRQPSFRTEARVSVPSQQRSQRAGAQPQREGQVRWDLRLGRRGAPGEWKTTRERHRGKGDPCHCGLTGFSLKAGQSEQRRGMQFSMFKGDQMSRVGVILAKLTYQYFCQKWGTGQGQGPRTRAVPELRLEGPDRSAQGDHLCQ